MKNLIKVCLVVAVMVVGLASGNGQNAASSGDVHDVVTNVSVGDTISDDEFTYKTLKQIELKIPHAVDSIAMALSRFSPEYQDWNFRLRIRSSDRQIMILIGEPGDKWIDSILHKYFIEKIGYVTVNGIDMDFDVFHRGGDFSDMNVDSLYVYTGESKTFKYFKDPLIVNDGTVEYHLGITDSALVLKKKIEHW